MMQITGRLVAVCAVLFGVACEPPGKPGPEQPSTENGEQVKDFKTLFSHNCSGCHGLEGKNGPARILNDSLYLAVIPREALKHTIENGRPGTPMPAWARSQGGPLTDAQVDVLVDGIYKNWAKPINLDAAPVYNTESTGDVTRGKRLFARSCFMCHGKGAPIGSVTDASYLSVASNQVLRTAIIVGRSDLGMPDYRHLNLGRALSDQDVTDIVAYLVSLRPASPGSPK
jgi:cytochrome c oxidase cbb3-type subunit III